MEIKAASESRMNLRFLSLKGKNFFLNNKNIYFSSIVSVRALLVTFILQK